MTKKNAIIFLQNILVHLDNLLIQI